MELNFETQRVLIRPIAAQDTDDLFTLFQSLDTRFFRHTPALHSTEDAQKFISEALQSTDAVNWALIDKESQHLMGLWHWGKRNAHEAFIYCCISPAYMRMGYMSEVAQALIARMPAFGLRKAIAEVPSGHLEARFFMLHFGWSCVSKSPDGFETWEMEVK